MSQFVEVAIVVPLYFSILLGWNNGFDARILRKCDDLVGVIPAVSEQVLCSKASYQLCCNCAIRCGTRCNKESYWHTMRIHGQMYLGIEPPLVRSMS